MRHEEFVVMRLTTIHTEAGRPGAIGKYECPACGAEMRQPLDLEETLVGVEVPDVVAPPAAQEA